MKDHPYKQNRVSTFLVRSFVFIIFWIIALTAIVYAMGFEVDFNNLGIKKTGIIYLASSVGEVEASVELDQEIISDDLPVSISRLKSDHYYTKISKTGYFDWQKSFEVMPNQVSAWEGVLLIKENKEVREADTEEQLQLDKQASEPLDETISIEKNELFIDEVLVTRFSENIFNAIWHPDGKHIAYQKGDKINLIETDGQNETLLIELKSNKPVTFRFLKKGQELLFEDEDQVLVAELYDK